MKSTAAMLVAALLIAVAVPSSSSAADSETILAQIRDIAKEEPQRYERLLARAWPLANKALKDQEWGVAENSLNLAGLKPVLAPDPDGEYRCVLLPSAYTLPNGSKMDLYLSLAVGGGRSQPTYAVPRDLRVLDVSIGLSVTLLAPHEDARSGVWFGKDTMIQAALSDWPVRDAQPTYPLVHEVDLSFGEVRDWTTGEEGEGFRLQLSLADGAGEKQTRRQLNCLASVSPVGQGRGPIRGWTRRDFSPSGAANTLVEDLRHIVKESAKDDTYHRLLQKATHRIQQAVIAQDWSVLSQQLTGQGLKLSPGSTWQKCVVAEKAYTTRGGQSMDMVAEIWIGRGISTTAATKEIVMQGYASLRADVQTPYADVVAKERFGKDTAVHKVLLHEDAKKAAQEHPFLKSIEVYYDVIGNRWMPENSWGFHVRPEFIVGPGNESATASVSFSIPSGLDPPDMGGSVVLIKDFIAKDTLGQVASHGGSSSKRLEGRSFFLTKKGEPRWRQKDRKEAEPVIAYSVGDLKTLPADTSAIKVENREIYDNDLTALPRLSELRSLDLGECEGITDKGLAQIAKLKKLESLTLSGERLSGAGFKRLAEMPLLTELTIYRSKGLNDEAIAALAEMAPLTRLTLSWASSLTDDQLAQLARLKALRQLSIWGSQNISDAGLKHISTLAKLEELTFSHSKKITANGIGKLVGLKNLQEISLGYMPLADDAMPPLSQIESLEYISLHGTDVTGAGLQALSKLSRLKRLYLDDCKGVRKNDVGAFKAKLNGEFELD